LKSLYSTPLFVVNLSCVGGARGLPAPGGRASALDIFRRRRPEAKVVSAQFLETAGALIKKENQIFLIYKVFQSRAVAKSYMRKGFLIYEEMRKYFPI